MEQNRFNFLLEKQLRESLTQEERAELYECFSDPTASLLIDSRISNEYQSAEGDLQLPKEAADQILQAILQSNKVEIPIRRIRWTALAIAASLLLLVGTGLIYFTKSKSPENIQSPIANLEAPKINRAHISLGNGQIIYLDSANNGNLAQQGEVELRKLQNGEIAYEFNPASSTFGTNQYNTLVNPRGSQLISVKLSDGSKVWLNAGSSLTYPVVFAQPQRMVDISGEAYFEIAQDPAKPFHVRHQEMDVQVLGTSFNVNTFKDNGNITATLIEGSVRVSAGDNSVLLKPALRADVNPTNSITVDKASIEQTLAWKNGFFSFNNSSLIEMARQIERWYDIDIRFIGQIKDIRIAGEMDRKVSVTGIVQFLKDYGFNAKLEGRTLIVSGR